MKAWIRLLSCIVGVAAIAAFLIDRRRMEKRYAALAAQVVSLHEDDQGRRTPQLPLFVNTPRAIEHVPSDQLADTTPRDSETTPSNTGDSHEAAPPTPKEQVKAVERVFMREARDQQWAAESEAQLTKDLTELSSDQAAIKTLDCRTSLCRAEVVHNSEAGFQSFATGLSRHLHWKGAGMFLRSDDPSSGAIESVMFLAKSDMPPIE